MEGWGCDGVGDGEVGRGEGGVRAKRMLGESRIRKMRRVGYEAVNVATADVVVERASRREGDVSVKMFFRAADPCGCGCDCGCGCACSCACACGRWVTGDVGVRAGIGPPRTGIPRLVFARLPGIRSDVTGLFTLPLCTGLWGYAWACDCAAGGVVGGVGGVENKPVSPSTNANLLSCANRARSRPCVYTAVSTDSPSV